MKKIKFYTESLKDLPFVAVIDGNDFMVKELEVRFDWFRDEHNFEEIPNYHVVIENIEIEGYVLNENDIILIQEHIYENHQQEE